MNIGFYENNLFYEVVVKFLTIGFLLNIHYSYEKKNNNNKI